jgi:hypothetical protein
VPGYPVRQQEMPEIEDQQLNLQRRWTDEARPMFEMEQPQIQRRQTEETEPKTRSGYGKERAANRQKSRDKELVLSDSQFARNSWADVDKMPKTTVDYLVTWANTLPSTRNLGDIHRGDRVPYNDRRDALTEVLKNLKALQDAGKDISLTSIAWMSNADWLAHYPGKRPQRNKRFHADVETAFKTAPARMPEETVGYAYEWARTLKSMEDIENTGRDDQAPYDDPRDALPMVLKHLKTLRNAGMDISLGSIASMSDAAWLFGFTGDRPQYLKEFHAAVKISAQSAIGQ